MSSTKTKRPKRPSTRDKWKPIMLVKIYRMARLGMTDGEITNTLEVDRKSLWNWLNGSTAKPELVEALAMARQERKERDSLPEWIYSHMTPELRALWDKIGKLEEGKNPAAAIEEILEDAGLRVRQELFLHALCMLQFSPSRALAKVNVTKKELDRWLMDGEFARLMEEILWHKGNFFEEHLVNLVQMNVPAAVIFANKTFNKDRGYASRHQLDVNVSGGVAVGVLDLAELTPYLSESGKLELLEAIRKREAEQLKTLNPVQMLSQRIVEVADASPDLEEETT